jgi:sugar O-acyltransferase (sialic acid O-acetyltransferase NeuD family)
MIEDGISSKNSDKTRILIIGGGAQAKYAVDTFTLRGIEVCAVMNLYDSDELDWPATYSCPVLPVNPSLNNALMSNPTHAIACMPKGLEKVEWLTIAKKAGLKPISAIHPSAVIAQTANIGEAVIINANAVIQPFASIGNGVMIHAGCIVEHNAIVEDYATLAPGARMAGWSQVGRGATVFTGANLIPSVKVGNESIVAAGATVINDVPDRVLVAGVPAELKKQLD